MVGSIMVHACLLKLAVEPGCSVCAATRLAEVPLVAFLVNDTGWAARFLLGRADPEEAVLPVKRSVIRA